MVPVYLRVGGRSIHLRSAELLTADFKKINHSQVKGEGMRKHRRIKGKIFSPTRLSLSAWIKFSQLPPMAFMDTICLLRDHSTHTWCMDTRAVEETHFLKQSFQLTLSFRFSFSQIVQFNGPNVCNRISPLCVSHSLCPYCSFTCLVLCSDTTEEADVPNGVLLNL